MVGRLKEMSDSSYRMQFGDGGEVWARLQGPVSNWRLNLNKAGRLSAEIDINRSLEDEMSRYRFDKGLKLFAEEREIPPPTTIHLRRQTYSDWPALYLDEFPDVMELMIRLVH